MRLIELKGAGYAVPAAAATLGQTAAHAPLQVDVPGALRSPSNTYTVCDCAFTKPAAPANGIVASGAAAGAATGVGVAVGATVGTAVGAAVLLGTGVVAEPPAAAVVAGIEDVVPLLPPHAVRIVTASAAAVGTMRRW